MGIDRTAIEGSYLNQYKISEETIEFMNKQCGLIKKGFLLLPVGLILVLTFLLKREGGEKSVLFVTIPMLAAAIIYIRGFVIKPMKKLNVLNLIVSEISTNDMGVEIFTKQLLWKSSIFSFVAFEDLKIIDGISNKQDNIFGYKPVFQLKNHSTKEHYYLSTEMFFNKQEVFEFIEGLKLRTGNNTNQR